MCHSVLVNDMLGPELNASTYILTFRRPDLVCSFTVLAVDVLVQQLLTATHGATEATLPLMGLHLLLSPFYCCKPEAK